MARAGRAVLVAATRAPVGETRGEVAIYSAATAQLVRVVTSGRAGAGVSTPLTINVVRGR